MLVEEATEWFGKVGEAEALRKLEAELDAPEGAARLVGATGVASDPELAGAFEAVLALVGSEGVTLTDRAGGGGEHER